MVNLSLRYWGDPVLSQRASEVDDINGSLASLVDGMVDTMHEARGLGLAAPQVGVQKRLFIYKTAEDGPTITVINPTIDETDGEWEYEEGCLSIPGLFFPIVRPKQVHLTGWDIDGHEVSIEADELEARCLQHELDHLDGRLLLELLDKGQRKRALRELRRRFEPSAGVGALRLAFLGTPEAAVPTLVGLVERGHDVTVVVSRADKRRGRGAAPTPSPVKAAAVALGLPVTQSLDDVVSAGVELGVVVAFGRIIRPPLLGAVPLVNVHFSLLPRWRGAAPVERAILAGDAVTGVCVMGLEAGLDTGPVYRRAETPVGADETVSHLRLRLAEMGRDLLVEALEEGLGTPVPQVGEVVYAAKVDPAELRIDWAASTEQIHRVVRLERAWTTWKGKRLLVVAAAPGRGAPAAPPAAAPGSLAGDVVRTGDGALRLVTVKPEGRGALDGAAWARGARPEAGSVLGS